MSDTQQADTEARSTYTIKSPNTGYSGRNGSLDFRGGQAVTDSAALAERFRSKGYHVTEGGEMAGDTTPISLTSGVRHTGSPRDAAVEGSDAAGPLSDAFLAPMGAGEGKDPHGPDVASPGLHGVPPAPVVPGEVPADADAQESKEVDAARPVLIDGEPVPENQGGDWLGDADKGEARPAGPLHMSDPGSEGKGPDAAHGLERPAGNASKDAWVAYAVEQGMSRDEAASMSRAGLAQRFPE